MTEAKEVLKRKADEEKEIAREAVDESAARIARSIGDTLDRTERGCSARQLRQDHSYRIRLERERTKRERVLETKEDLARSHHRELVRAKKDEQVLEKLRQRHRSSMVKEERRREQKALDEAAGRTFYPKGGDE